MKLSKHYYKLGIIVIMGSIGSYFLYKYIMEKILIQRFTTNILRLSKNFKPAIIMNMERIYRIETANFKSRQFKQTYSPGMEKFGDSYPYGWKTLHKILWSFKPEFKPIGFKKFTENKTGKTKYFLVFKTLYAAMYTVCAFLQYYNNNPGRWYSLDTDAQSRYNKNILAFKPTLSEKMLIV